jgi:hypothetical protein
VTLVLPPMSYSWFRPLCWLLAGSVVTLRVQAQAAEDHLQPAKGYYTSGQAAYYSKVPEVLFAGLHGTPLARVVVLPSLLPEYMLSLDRQADKVYLTYQSTQQTSLWHELQTKSGVTPPLETKVVELQPEVATALTHLVSLAVGQTRYPKPTDTVTMRNDGNTFTFLYMQPHVGWQAGETWSPPAATHMGRLVGVVEHLRQLAMGAPSAGAQAALLVESTQLRAELAQF